MKNSRVHRPVLFKSAPRNDRPRERLLAYGGESVSDTELVSVLLQVGRDGRASLELARTLLSKIGGLYGLVGRPVGPRLCGLGRVGQATIVAAIELSRRLAQGRLRRRGLLADPELVTQYLRLRFFRADQETMGALYCDVGNRLLAEREVYRGTLGRAAVEPRLLIKHALLLEADGFVLFHTHPSGDPTPSEEDLSFTKRIANSGDLLRVRLLDHLIVGSGQRWVSLARAGGW